MSAPLDPATLQRFRKWIRRRTALEFDETKNTMLAEILERGARDTTPSRYLERIEGFDGDEEVRILAPELTVGETYFFRNHEQFDALREVVVPQRLAAGRADLRLLSAGCASGEEAYTLAMTTATVPGVVASIVGVDLNRRALERASRARYSEWSLRETPADARQRWFQPVGKDYVVEPGIRDAVRFEERNLAEDGALWAPATYDVVFCRNVSMYFSQEEARRLMARISRALAPGGFLFLGHAETLRGLSDDFHLCHTHETFYYERKEALAEPRPFPATPVPMAAPPDAGWIDAVGNASIRIQALAERAVGERGTAAPADLGPAVELLRQERYGDALSAVAGERDDPEALLLRAVLLAHRGSWARAEEACVALLARRELDAGAHYVMALCREGAADVTGAVEHHRIASYLDPGFALPHLHLGLLARRAGDTHTARRELGAAAALLAREDAARLLLFGSGFGREALVAMCHAELLALGGNP